MLHVCHDASSYYVGFRNWTQGIKLGYWHLYLISCLANSSKNQLSLMPSSSHCCQSHSFGELPEETPLWGKLWPPMRQTSIAKTKKYILLSHKPSLNTNQFRLIYYFLVSRIQDTLFTLFWQSFLLYNSDWPRTHPVSSHAVLRLMMIFWLSFLTAGITGMSGHARPQSRVY